MTFRRNLLALCAVAAVFSVTGISAGSLPEGVIMQCDVGACGAVEDGWIDLPGCGTYYNVGGTGIDVILQTGAPGACECRDPGATGTLANVGRDLVFANDQTASPYADFILTLSNLAPGKAYELRSYHCWTRADVYTIPGVTITGATVISQPDTIAQAPAIMDNPAVFVFLAGSEDVVIRYLAPLSGCKGCQAYFNGFVLAEGQLTTITFVSTVSGGMETINPALVPVIVSQPQSGTTYTVDYAVAGGTATAAVDYNLTAGTLTFATGETLKNIEIEIIKDDNQEPDETIILSLSDPSGSVLGLAENTYVISDSQPKVGFSQAASLGSEDVGQSQLELSMSHAGDQTVTVDYAVVGGSADPGSDYNIADGTISFSTPETVQNIPVDIVDDIQAEGRDTIVLMLFDPINAGFGPNYLHTYSIIDNEDRIFWDGQYWFYNSASARPFVNNDGDLEWDPEGDSGIFTRIPEQRLSQVGDVVELEYMWMTDGAHDCADCFACPDGCYDGDITCISGAADFRIGMYQSNGQYPFSGDTGDYSGYRGYNFRFGPNMVSGPNRWEDCTGEVHKTGNFVKKDEAWDDLGLSTNTGFFGDYIDGFELDPGEYSFFRIRYERLSSSSIEISITLNGRTQSATDNSGSGQPQMVDVLAIYMRNKRVYNRMVLRSLETSSCPGDFTDNRQINGVDLAVMTREWPKQNVPENTADMNEDGNINNFDFALFANQWLEPCPSAAPCDVIDDFESYGDTAQLLGQWQGEGGGAGFVSLSAISHGVGFKSLEMEYNNILLYKYSAAVHQFDSPQDWTAGDRTGLVLYFRGRIGNTSDRMYLAVEDSLGAEAAADHNPDLTSESWQAWRVEFGGLSGADLTKVSKLTVGLGDPDAASAVGVGNIYLDDIGLCSSAP